MKTIKLLILIFPPVIFLLWGMSACHSVKQKNRQQNVLLRDSRTDSSVTKLHNLNYSQLITRTDSNNQFYHIVIFPADTVQFSLQEGFAGKAHKIEVTGLSRQVGQSNTQVNVSENERLNLSVKTRSRINQKQTAESKSIERKTLSKSTIWMMAFVAGLIIVLLRYLRRQG